MPFSSVSAFDASHHLTWSVFRSTSVGCGKLTGTMQASICDAPAADACTTTVRPFVKTPQPDDEWGAGFLESLELSITHRPLPKV